MQFGHKIRTKTAVLISCLGLSNISSPSLARESSGLVDEAAYKSQVFLTRIKAASLWNLLGDHEPSEKVKVLICDTGIESAHQTLAHMIELPGTNSVDGSQNTEPSGHGHGTRMAGLINVVANNQTDLARVIPGKISNLANGLAVHTASAKCIRWAADHGIRIVNLSYSGAANNQDVIEAAQYLHDHNGVLFLSAGDVSGETRNIPDDPNMIVVGYVNSDNFILSTRGPYVDLVAPGTSIVTTDLRGVFTDRYHGASEAVAIVSGAAALMLAYKPGLTATELSQIILNSTNDILAPGRDINSGHGFLNLEKAIPFLTR